MTPLHAQESAREFVPLEDGSGLLDTETGIIWGHTLWHAQGFLGGGAGFTWERSMDMMLSFPSGEGKSGLSAGDLIDLQRVSVD